MSATASTTAQPLLLRLLLCELCFNAFGSLAAQQSGVGGVPRLQKVKHTDGGEMHPADQHPTVPVWPLPTRAAVVAGSSPVALSPANFTISASGPGSRSEVLVRAIARYQSNLTFTWPSPQVRVLDLSTAAALPFVLTLNVASADETLQVGSCGNRDPRIRCVDESYRLSVRESGAAVAAPSIYGAMHAMETFAQLVQHASDGTYHVPAIDIEDAPRFEYRGCMIDTSRHFLNVSTILRIIDSMALQKLNVLQVHLTDDQSFPFRSTSHPNLTTFGAFNKAMTYSHADIRAITRYANDRGIVCQVETDLPAHAASWHGERGFLRNRTGMPDPSSNQTYKVIQDVLTELASLGVSDTHHIGGDEFTPAGWMSDPALMKWAAQERLSVDGGCKRSTPSGSHVYNKTDCSLLCRFHQNHARAAKAAGFKNIYMWSDASGCEGLNELFPNAIVDLWEGGEMFHGCKGDRCVNSDWGPGAVGQKDEWRSYYLDYVFKNGWPGTVTQDSGTGFSRAVVSGCFHLECPSIRYNWTYNYACGSRLQNFTMTGFSNQNWNTTQKSVVIGGHVSRWGESTNTDNWFYHSYPALFGVSEALWATEEQTQPTIANLTKAEVRLRAIICRMIRVGAAQPFNATAVGPMQRLNLQWTNSDQGFEFCSEGWKPVPPSPLPPPPPPPPSPPPAPPRPSPPPSPSPPVGDCTILNAQHGGPVIGTHSLTGKSGLGPSECCAACDELPHCVAFTVSIDPDGQKECWLKDNRQNGTTCTHPRCISGTKNHHYVASTPANDDGRWSTGLS